MFFLPFFFFLTLWATYLSFRFAVFAKRLLLCIANAPNTALTKTTRNLWKALNKKIRYSPSPLHVDLLCRGGKRTLKLDHLLRNPKKPSSFSLSLLKWRSKNLGHLEPAGAGRGADRPCNSEWQAVGQGNREGIPTPGCVWFTDRRAAPSLPGAKFALSSSAIPQALGRPHKRGFSLFCASRGSFPQSLSLPALPDPLSAGLYPLLHAPGMPRVPLRCTLKRTLGPASDPG